MPDITPIASMMLKDANLTASSPNVAAPDINKEAAMDTIGLVMGNPDVNKAAAMDATSPAFA